MEIFCRKCGKSWPATKKYFPFFKSKFYQPCKKCRTEAQKERHRELKKDPVRSEKLLKYQSEYRNKNSQEYRDYQRIYRRKYRLKNKLLGKTFGRLTVIAKTDKKVGSNIVYLCQCKCGNTCEVTSNHLGTTTNSCGCLRIDTAVKDVVEGTRLNNIKSKKRDRVVKDSGVKGVIWDTPANKWRAQIGFKGKRINLGRFIDLQEAIEARKKAEELYFRPILDKYEMKTKEDLS